jgi:hypothetical protein
MSTPQFNSNLLDIGIDDIDDLPGFECPVPGIYSLKFSTSTKVVAMKGVDKDCVEANFEVIECLEQNDPAADPTKAGTKFSVLFQLGQEVAMGKMKELLMPVAKHFGEGNLGKLVTDTCKDLIITAKVARRADKEDKEKFYPVISNVTIA